MIWPIPMSEKIYIVTLHKKEDLEQFYIEMKDKGFRLNAKRPISRNTHYWMTEEQAIELRKDSRVWDVERLDSLKFERVADRNREPYLETGNFWKESQGGGVSPNDLQWGIVHCAGDDGQRAKGLFGALNTGGNYEQYNGIVEVFDNGEHVDVVICDDPVSYDSKEWYSPTKGVTRFVQYQWFNELNTIVNSIDDDSQSEPTGTITYGINSNTTQYHGNHVAGTVAGQHYGWAREANIYNIATTDPWPSGQQVGPLLMFDYLRAFHLNKPINPVTGYRNPTISNHSYGGYFDMPGEDTLQFSDINYIVYQGVQYSAANPGPSGWNAAGVVTDFGVRYLDKYNSFSAAVAADVKDAVDDGVVVVGSAGNRNMHIAEFGDPDWDNIINIQGLGSRNYMRGSWPNVPTSGSVIVGALSNHHEFRRSTYSNFGPAIDVFAPGDDIISAYGNTGLIDAKYGAGNFFYPISGTSMAAPQVAGVAACLASRKERFTNDDLRRYLNNKSKYFDMTVDAFGGTYDDATCSKGSPNKYLLAKNPRESSGVFIPLGGVRQTGQTFPRPKIYSRQGGELLTNGTVFNPYTITHNWTEGSSVVSHTYLVDIRVPPAPLTGSFPVAILLHGAGGNGSQMITDWDTRLPNHILIAPTGYNNVWNIVDESDAPDVIFLTRLMTELEAFMNVRKIDGIGEFAYIGYSNGAAMALKMGVEYQGANITHVAALVSQMHDQQFRNGSWYKPSNHENTDSTNANKGYDTSFVPYGVSNNSPNGKGRKFLQINGENDGIIPYEGGNGPGGATFLNARSSLYTIASNMHLYPSPEQTSFDFHYTPHTSLLIQTYITNRIYDDLVALHGKQVGAGHGVTTEMKDCVEEFIENAGGVISLTPVVNNQTYNLSVSNAGAGSYTFTGSDSTTNHANSLDPVISMNVGDTINFNLNIIGSHPFWIKTVRTTGTGFGVSGVINNGFNSGVVSWTPTTAGTYWYICQFHFGMANTIVVS